jgi:UDP-N-acetyl-D-mannosaminuronate dehydrogenase
MLEMKHTTDIDTLLQRIERRCAAIGVIGLGYVGLPLAIAFNFAR